MRAYIHKKPTAPQEIIKEQCDQLDALLNSIPRNRLLEITADYLDIIKEDALPIKLNDKESHCRTISSYDGDDIIVYPTLAITRKDFRHLQRKEFEQVKSSDQQLENAIVTLGVRCAIKIGDIPARDTPRYPNFTREEKKVIFKAIYIKSHFTLNTILETASDEMMDEFVDICKYIAQKRLTRIPVPSNFEKYFLNVDKYKKFGRLDFPIFVGSSDEMGERPLKEFMTMTLINTIELARYYLEESDDDTMNQQIIELLSDIETVVENDISYEDSFIAIEDLFMWIVNYCKTYHRIIELPDVPQGDFVNAFIY